MTNKANLNLMFPSSWVAEILPARPLILPKKQFVYPQQAEEVERGALEVMVQPATGEPFLATCALGFEQIVYRPVLEVRALPDQGLLLFVGHHSLLAWGAGGKVWQTERLSSEGVTITGVEGDVLLGVGWDLMTDADLPFVLDLKTGKRM
jgi:hypothetical protein